MTRKRKPTAVERVEQEEFSRGGLPSGSEPVEARPAATIVVVREKQAPLEVLLLRRPEQARFAAGAWVFPGGVIDPADREPAVAGWFAGEDGAPHPEPFALAAGLRELFEETGILVADWPPDPVKAREARTELLADRTTFPEVVRRLGLSFRRAPIAYIARWITPELLARRYDTRFFLARAPAGAAPSLTREHTEYAWLAPAEALERFHSGGLPMLFPTWKTLERLAGFPDLATAWETLSREPVKPIQARLVLEEGKVRPVMPGDPGYEDGR